jgi:hypothetical protein
MENDTPLCKNANCQKPLSKHGRTPIGTPRWICKDCKKTYTGSMRGPRPLENPSLGTLQVRRQREKQRLIKDKCTPWPIFFFDANRAGVQTVRAYDSEEWQLIVREYGNHALDAKELRPSEDYKPGDPFSPVPVELHRFGFYWEYVFARDKDGNQGLNNNARTLGEFLEQYGIDVGILMNGISARGKDGQP